MNSCNNECNSIVRMKYVVDRAVDVEVCRQIGRIYALNGGSIVGMPGSGCCSRFNSLLAAARGKRKKTDNGEGRHKMGVRLQAAGIGSERLRCGLLRKWVGQPGCPKK